MAWGLGHTGIGTTVLCWLCGHQVSDLELPHQSCVCVGSETRGWKVALRLEVLTAEKRAGAQSGKQQVKLLLSLLLTTE